MNFLSYSMWNDKQNSPYPRLRTRFDTIYNDMIFNYIDIIRFEPKKLHESWFYNACTRLKKLKLGCDQNNSNN